MRRLPLLPGSFPSTRSILSFVFDADEVLSDEVEDDERLLCVM